MLQTTTKRTSQNYIQEILATVDIEINGDRPWDVIVEMNGQKDTIAEQL